MLDPILQSPQSNGFEDYGQDQVPVDSYTFTEIVVPAAKAARQVEGVVNGCEPGLVGVLGGAPAGEQSSSAYSGPVGRKLLKMLDWGV